MLSPGVFEVRCCNKQRTVPYTMLLVSEMPAGLADPSNDADHFSLAVEVETSMQYALPPLSANTTVSDEMTVGAVFTGLLALYRTVLLAVGTGARQKDKPKRVRG